MAQVARGRVWAPVEDVVGKSNPQTTSEWSTPRCTTRWRFWYYHCSYATTDHKGSWTPQAELVARRDRGTACPRCAGLGKCGFSVVAWSNRSCAESTASGVFGIDSKGDASLWCSQSDIRAGGGPRCCPASVWMFYYLAALQAGRDETD